LASQKPQPQINKSFLLLFYKKAVLASLKQKVFSDAVESGPSRYRPVFDATMQALILL
jgi:hypothetical protein